VFPTSDSPAVFSLRFGQQFRVLLCCLILISGRSRAPFYGEAEALHATLHLDGDRAKFVQQTKCAKCNSECFPTFFCHLRSDAATTRYDVPIWTDYALFRKHFLMIDSSFTTLVGEERGQHRRLLFRQRRQRRLRGGQVRQHAVRHLLAEPCALAAGAVEGAQLQDGACARVSL